MKSLYMRPRAALELGEPIGTAGDKTLSVTVCHSTQSTLFGIPEPIAGLKSASSCACILSLMTLTGQATHT
jgi:hypothetical protein